MEDSTPTGMDDPKKLPAIELEEIFEAESIERYPDERIVVIDGEARFDPYAEFVTDNSR